MTRSCRTQCNQRKGHVSCDLLMRVIGLGHTSNMLYLDALQDALT